MTAPVKYGLYYFLASSGLTLLLYLVSKDLMFNPTLGFISGIALSILFVVLAIRADRADEGGYTMAEGIKSGMITYGIGTLLSTIFLYVLVNIIDPSLIDTAIELTKAIAEKTANTVAGMMGADDAQKAEMMEEINAQEITNPYTIGKIGIGWIIGLIFPGLIICLIAAAIMKKN